MLKDLSDKDLIEADVDFSPQEDRRFEINTCVLSEKDRKRCPVLCIVLLFENPGFTNWRHKQKRAQAT